MLQVLIAGTLDSHDSNAVMGRMETATGRVKTGNVHVLAIPPQLLCVHLYYSSCFLQTAHWPCLQHEKSTELNDREEGRVRGKGNDTNGLGLISLCCPSLLRLLPPTVFVFIGGGIVKKTNSP